MKEFKGSIAILVFILFLVVLCVIAVYAINCREFNWVASSCRIWATSVPSTPPFFLTPSQ